MKYREARKRMKYRETRKRIVKHIAVLSLLFFVLTMVGISLLIFRAIGG